MIHLLNNLPKEYDIILDGPKNDLTPSGNDILAIEVIREKLNHKYEKLRMNKKEKKKKPERSMEDSIKADVASMVNVIISPNFIS